MPPGRELSARGALRELCASVRAPCASSMEEVVTSQPHTNLVGGFVPDRDSSSFAWRRQTLVFNNHDAGKFEFRDQLRDCNGFINLKNHVFE